MLNFFKKNKLDIKEIDYKLDKTQEFIEFENNFSIEKKEKIQNSMYKNNYEFKDFAGKLEINLKKDPIFDYEYTLYDYFLNFPKEISAFLLEKGELLQNKIYKKYVKKAKIHKKYKFINFSLLIFAIISFLLYINFKNDLILNLFHGFFWAFFLFSIFILFWSDNNLNQYSILKNISTDINILIKENQKEFEIKEKSNLSLKQAEQKLINYLQDLEIFYIDKERKLKINKELNIQKKIILISLILIFFQISLSLGIFLLSFSILKLFTLFSIKINKNQWIEFFQINQKFLINNLYFEFCKNKIQKIKK